MVMVRKNKVKKKRRRRQKFEKQKCTFVNDDGKRCNKTAVGKGVVCTDHGGDRFELAISAKETQDYVSIVTTKFIPEFHPIEFIDLSRGGKSVVEIAAEFQVGVPTLESWADSFREMSVAYEIGKALHEAWWLQKGKDGLDERFFNTSLFKFLTGNKLGYSDKLESKNWNLNQTVHGVLAVPATASEAEWEQSFEEEN